MVRVRGAVFTVFSGQRETGGAGPSRAHCQVEGAECAATEEVCMKYFSAHIKSSYLPVVSEKLLRRRVVNIKPLSA